MNIIVEVAKQCARADCEFHFEMLGFKNERGSYSDVKCLTCKRKWTAFTPKTMTTYNREGTRILAQQPVEITEIKR